MADTSRPTRERAGIGTGRRPISLDGRTRLLKCIRQGAQMRSTAERTQATVEALLRLELCRAIKLGIPVEEIARDSGLDAEAIYALTGEVPPFRSRRSHA